MKIKFKKKMKSSPKILDNPGYDPMKLHPGANYLVVEKCRKT